VEDVLFSGFEATIPLMDNTLQPALLFQWD
jgi:hypothetical protein